MFVIVLSYVKPIEVLDKLRPSHIEFLDRYYAKNIFVASGRQNPVKGGVILANNTTRSDLEKIITEDPFYTEKAATYEIIEFTATKVHPEIAKLVVKV